MDGGEFWIAGSGFELSDSCAGNAGGEGEGLLRQIQGKTGDKKILSKDSRKTHIALGGGHGEFLQGWEAKISLAQPCGRPLPCGQGCAGHGSTTTHVMRGQEVRNDDRHISSYSYRLSRTR